MGPDSISFLSQLGNLYSSYMDANILSSSKLLPTTTSTVFNSLKLLLSF